MAPARASRTMASSVNRRSACAAVMARTRRWALLESRKMDEVMPTVKLKIPMTTRSSIRVRPRGCRAILAPVIEAFFGGQRLELSSDGPPADDRGDGQARQRLGTEAGRGAAHESFDARASVAADVLERQDARVG